ncbi:MAG: MFS transporter [Acidobacteriota bacterium]
MPFQWSFYGWRLAVVAFFLYGCQVVGYYGWGFYLPEALEELDMTRAQGGLVFGLYSLVGGLVSPLVGVAIGRFGLRWTMAAGFLLSSVGYYGVGQSQSMLHLLLTFGVWTAGTHAFATVIPTQTLASTWFVKYRARVLAALLSAGGLLSVAVYEFLAWVLQVATWRDGWTWIAAINVALGVLALAFVRNSPEALGQLPDGAPDRETLAAWTPKSQADDGWTAKEALRTPQFAFMVLCGLGYAVPWGVLANHGRLHLQDIGFSLEIAAVVLATMPFVSTFGRLTGALGDWIAPPKLLSLALLLEGIGVLLFLRAQTQTTATVAAALVGLGFGMAYISQAATFARFFGRRAFATTTGVRFLIGALFSASVPAIAGWVFDTQGTYAPAFLGMAGVTLAGSVVAFLLRSPQRTADASS